MAPQSSEPPPRDPNLPNKRRKTQLACHPCRARKTGCDGRRPCCTSCGLRGWQDRCTYQDATPAASTLTLLDLEDRVKKLEASTQKSPLPSSSQRAKDASYPPTATENTGGSAAASPQSPITEGGTSKPDPNSNFSFVQQIADAVGTGFDEPIETGGAGVVSQVLGYNVSRAIATDWSLKDLVLPPPQLADRLLRCYWELCHPLFPILHRPSFTSAYDKLWQPAGESPSSDQKTVEDAVFYSTVNIVLALGSQRSEDLNEFEREDLSDAFYKRSLKLASLDTLDTLSLAVVQLLLLRGLYLLYTHYADRCWNTVGAALRVAHAVGLQSDLSSTGTSQLDREMHRRVWHHCVFIDWLTSISFGRRPTLTKPTKVPLPALIDDEYLSDHDEGRQPANIPPLLACFVHGLTLLEVGERSEGLGRLCPDSRSPVYSGKALGAVLDLKLTVDRFIETLPPHLQCEDDLLQMGSKGETGFQLQAKVLQSRALYARLRILRPLLVSEVRRCSTQVSGSVDRFSLTPEGRLCKDLCLICVSTAEDALQQLHNQLSSVYRSSPWHSLYFTFAAASTIIAATMVPYLDIRIDGEFFGSCWEKAMDIFRFHRAHVASADQGIEALVRFRRHIGTRGSTNSSGGNTDVEGGLTSDSTSQTSLSEAHTLFFSDLFDGTVPLDQSWILSQDFNLNDFIQGWQ